MFKEHLPAELLGKFQPCRYIATNGLNPPLKVGYDSPHPRGRYVLEGFQSLVIRPLANAGRQIDVFLRFLDVVRGIPLETCAPRGRVSLAEEGSAQGI